MIMITMQEKYSHFHLQMLTVDGKAIHLYNKVGFVKAGDTEPV